MKDKSDMTRTTLDDPCQELEALCLEESAILYTELYDEDAALQALTELAVVGCVQRQLELHIDDN